MNQRINYLSDFKLIEDGENFDAPFEFRYRTSLKEYIVSHKDGRYNNCKMLSDGRLMVLFQNHGLNAGWLMCERRFYLTDEDFESGICNLVDFRETGIVLVYGSTDSVNVSVTLPPFYQKGDPFTYGDFTPEQLDDLRRPATEAAQAVTMKINELEKVQTVWETNERTRTKNENERSTSEQARIKQETARVKAEDARGTEWSKLSTEASIATKNAQDAAQQAIDAASGIDQYNQRITDIESGYLTGNIVTNVKQ